MKAAPMLMPTGARIDNPADSLAFLLAGNARATFVSLRTGKRFTYEVRQPALGGPHFVGVLTAPDYYTHLGTIFADHTFWRSRASRVEQGAPSMKAFHWVWNHLLQGRNHPELEVWHEGSCGKCGRPLTTPESIARGLGPVCARMGAPRPAGLRRVPDPDPNNGQAGRQARHHTLDEQASTKAKSARS